MKRHIYRVISFSVVKPFTLSVRFDDGVEQTVDFRPVLRGEMYGPLREPDVFNSVMLDSEIGTLVWPNGADFDPAVLHDWPECGPELAERAERWTEDAERKSAGTLAVAEDKTDCKTGDKKKVSR